jgi:hypothetical protein
MQIGASLFKSDIKEEDTVNFGYFQKFTIKWW